MSDLLSAADRLTRRWAEYRDTRFAHPPEFRSRWVTRGLQRALVPESAAGACRDRNLAARMQPRSAEKGPWRKDSRGLPEGTCRGSATLIGDPKQPRC